MTQEEYRKARMEREYLHRVREQVNRRVEELSGKPEMAQALYNCKRRKVDITNKIALLSMEIGDYEDAQLKAEQEKAGEA